ncbi:hypothetical protein [Curtobacterium sp. UNCCL17]|nr:hypothetical protein [Curtobacterium sp. UNCCL17]
MAEKDTPAQQQPPKRPDTDSTFKHVQESGGGKPRPTDRPQ